MEGTSSPPLLARPAAAIPLRRAAAERRVSLGHIGLERLSWPATPAGASVSLEVRHGQVALYLPLAGCFEIGEEGAWLSVGPAAQLAIHAGGRARRRVEAGCELIRVTLAEGLAPASDGLLARQPLAVIEGTEAAAFIRLADAITAELESAGAGFAHPAVGQQLERTLLLLLSVGLAAGGRQGGPLRIAPFYVRRAERYIRENAARCIAIADLAAAAGTSERTLYDGFRKYRNTSPARYLKSVRLELAREALLAARTAPCKIAAVAAGVGYRSLSQFSRDYRERFRETPRETLHGA